MKNMKLTPKEATKECMPCDNEYKGPEYPYGLRVCLDGESMDKLGLKELPDVGTKMKLVAIVEVVGARIDKGQDREYKNVDLQITDMELASAKTEKSTEDALYSKD